MRHGDDMGRGSGKPLKHDSARGSVVRNTNDFTRGSQLISHQARMFGAGAKFPLLIWFAAFTVIYWTSMYFVMGEHEIQLCGVKIYAGLWDWIEFSPFKPVNVRMPDGSDRLTYMGYVEHIPAVQIAWAKAVHAITGAFFGSLLIAMPLIFWFITASTKRGSTILQERHERGAMLVERHVLLDDILAHNSAQFEAKVVELFPGKTGKQVRLMPLAQRKAAGLHHPYNLAGIHFPYGLEQSHTMLIGTTGSGKSTQLLDLVRQVRAHGDSGVIFDLTGDYARAFYNPATDIILNPADARCPSWSIFHECCTQSEFTSAAAALIPSDGNNADPFWAMAARTLFIQMCLKLQEAGKGTNKALADNLMTADLKKVHKILQDTIADPITAPEAARMAESIRAVFNTNAQALQTLPEDGPDFSIREWIRRERKPGSLIFITTSYGDMAMYKTLLTLWMDIAINTLMTLPRTRNLRTWFIFDELGALHRLPAIENGLQTARGFGGAMVLGMHSFARLKAIYGDDGAENLLSLARTKLILATADLDTAEQCAKYIGNREVRQMDEAYSYGADSIRDASTLTPRKQVEPLVIPDDITNLPSLHGFIKFPDGFPAARIKLAWKAYPEIAPGFAPRATAVPAKRSDGDGSGEGTAAVAPDGTPPGGRDGGVEVTVQTPCPDQLRGGVALAQASALDLGGIGSEASDTHNPILIDLGAVHSQSSGADVQATTALANGHEIDPTSPEVIGQGPKPDITDDRSRDSGAPSPHQGDTVRNGAGDNGAGDNGGVKNSHGENGHGERGVAQNGNDSAAQSERRDNGYSRGYGPYSDPHEDQSDRERRLDLGGPDELDHGAEI